MSLSKEDLPVQEEEATVGTQAMEHTERRELLTAASDSLQTEYASSHTSSHMPALGTMSLAALEEHCMSEIKNFRNGEPFDDRYCLEIFYRAITKQNAEAWDLLQRRFSPLVLGWLRRDSRHDLACRYDSEENYMAQAFARFWQATVRNQNLQFGSLAAALRYLHTSLNGAIIDTLRAYDRPVEIPWPERGQFGFEEPAVEDEEGSELWEVIKSLLPEAREQRLAYLLFHCGLKPREIVKYCPSDFSDVQIVYSLRRNIFERLLRNADLIRWRLNDSIQPFL
jgi:integrase